MIAIEPFLLNMSRVCCSFYSCLTTDDLADETSWNPVSKADVFFFLCVMLYQSSMCKLGSVVLRWCGRGPPPLNKVS